MSKLEVAWTNQFKKDYKNAVKRHLDINLLDEIITKIANLEKLDDKYKDHYLTGNWVAYKECHIKPDF